MRSRKQEFSSGHPRIIGCFKKRRIHTFVSELFLMNITSLLPVVKTKNNLGTFFVTRLIKSLGQWGFVPNQNVVHRKQNVTDQLKATYRRTINSDVIIILKHASGSKGNICTETLVVLLDRLLTKLMI